MVQIFIVTDCSVRIASSRDYCLRGGRVGSLLISVKSVLGSEGGNKTNE